jgi:pimeloyl-ACP methyl ester carboxylesterase
MPLHTQFITSPDGTRIAYDVTGTGPALFLLHGGFVQDRSDWHAQGYVEKLHREYTTIAIDIRGHGESGVSHEADAYAWEKVLGDIYAVADAVSISDFFVWGFSLGATLALALAATSERVNAAVVGGSHFGTIFTQTMVQRMVADMAPIVQAKAEGRLDALNLPEARRTFAAKADLKVVAAWYSALADYRPVEPEDLRCPTLIYAGSANEPTAAVLNSYRDKTDPRRVRLTLFEGLTHPQEFTQIETALPPIVSFLHEVRSQGGLVL